MIYAIYEDFYADVEKKLNRIAKKCVKHGNNFVFEVKGEEIRESFNDELKRKEYHKFILVEVDGTAKIDDWECIAVLEKHEVGNIIRRINTTIDIPERFKHTENVCEHCNTRRQRNNLYIIHNVKTDEWKQVGGSCLKLYTGGLSMEYVAAYMDGIAELEEHDEVVRIGGKVYWNVKEVLGYAVETINKIGYYNATSNIPTKNIVMTLMNRRLDKAVESINDTFLNARMNVRVSESDFHKDGTAETVKRIIEHYESVEDNTEFMHNISIILSGEYMNPKNVGYLCYLPEGYARHIKKEVKEAKKRAETSYFGEIGKRYKDKSISDVTLITTWESQFGVTYIYKIILEDGAVLTWKTNRSLYINDGEEFDKIDFTIKEHKEYKGEKQTEVTRCKITKRNK